MPRKQAKWPKMAKIAIKQLQKCKKLGKNHEKKTDQKSNLKYAPIGSPCSMPPRGPSKSNTICIRKRDHSGSVP